MRLLKIAAADLGRWDLGRDGEHRRAAAMGVVEPVDEVQVARPAAPGTDGELARQMRLSSGRERGDFLVPDVNPLDLSLAPNGVGQPVEAITHDAVDALDPCGG